MKKRLPPIVIIAPAATDPDQRRGPACDALDSAELTKSLAALDQSMEDIKAGRVEPLKDAVRGIARQLALELGE